MNRVLLRLGPVTIYWYSITMLLAILTGIYLSLKEAKRLGKKDYFENLIFSLIVFGIIGARIYYVIFFFYIYKNDLLSIFKIWEGGIAIYGAIIAGLLVTIYYAKKYKESILLTTDIIAPSLIIAQAIGRWGNFFNQEAHGTEVTLSFLKKLHLPNFIIKGMHINGVYYHPTFLYESLWCIIGFIILIMIRKKTKPPEGSITYTYFIWYGLGRLLIEGLRTDSLYIGNIRVSQLVSIILILIGIVGIIINIKKERGKKWKKKEMS